MGLIPGLRSSSRRGYGNPPLCSCWENLMDTGAGRVIYGPWGHKESDTMKQRSSSSRTLLTWCLCFTGAPLCQFFSWWLKPGDQGQSIVSLPHPAVNLRHAEYVFLGVIGWEDNQGQEELGVFCILIWTEATCMFVRDLWALDVYNLLKFAKKKK